MDVHSKMPPPINFYKIKRKKMFCFYICDLECLTYRKTNSDIQMFDDACRQLLDYIPLRLGGGGLVLSTEKCQKRRHFEYVKTDET